MDEENEDPSLPLSKSVCVCEGQTLEGNTDEDSLSRFRFRYRGETRVLSLAFFGSFERKLSLKSIKGT